MPSMDGWLVRVLWQSVYVAPAWVTVPRPVAEEQGLYSPCASTM